MSTGDEIHISGEKFNVISQTDETVTMLAQYNLGTDYKQSKDNNYVRFSNGYGWEYTPGPKEIDIEEWSTNPKTYVNTYVEYLKTELGDTTIKGDLITVNELKILGCVMSDDYSGSSESDCNNSLNKSWLLNGQKWWTHSAVSGSELQVWIVYENGDLSANGYAGKDGIRPTITISKETLKGLNS